jgi:hypothetical protein
VSAGFLDIFNKLLGGILKGGEPMEHDEHEIDSEELDLITVFEGAGSSSEMEALQVQALLESNGIEAVLIGDTRFPNVPEAVRVAREDVERAQQLISDALAAGPAGALEAETAGETSPPTSSK